MNANQRKVLIVVAIVMALSLLFPPFQHVTASGVAENLGYGLIFMPPEVEMVFGSPELGAVNIKQLLVQWLGILVVGAILFVLAKKD